MVARYDESPTKNHGYVLLTAEEQKGKAKNSKCYKENTYNLEVQMNNIFSFTDARVDLESIGARIKQVRQSNHLTVEQFAEEMGVSENAVYKWQRGETVPDIMNFGYLSTHFGVSLDYLILGRGDSDELSPLPLCA